MALQDAILAALATREASGYDLAKAFDVTVASFWTATPQQLYRELDRMEAAGLVEARVVEQVKRPTKRLFSLTDDGRAALRDFTARAPRPTAIRDELLVQVQALEGGDAAAVVAHLRAKADASRHKLAGYERTRDVMLGGRDEAAYLADERSVGPFLTLARGIAFERDTIAWCEHVLRVLEARSSAS